MPIFKSFYVNGKKGQLKRKNTSFLNGRGCENHVLKEKQRTGKRSFLLPEWTGPYSHFINSLLQLVDFFLVLPFIFYAAGRNLSLRPMKLEVI